MDDYVTTAEASKSLKIHRVSVVKWCQRGWLPGAVKRGREWFIPKAALKRADVKGRKRTCGRPRKEAS